MNNLAVERRDFLNSPLPLTPEFIRNIRLLGRRPTAQLITDNLIKKYGTHFLLSATLGGRNLYFCDTSSWWFSAKFIIPTVSELCFFFFLLQKTDSSHAYLHLNFHSNQAKEKSLVTSFASYCLIMYYFFHCVFGREGRCKQMGSCPEWVTFLKSTHIISLSFQTRKGLCLQVASRNATVLPVRN